MSGLCMLKVNVAIVRQYLKNSLAMQIFKLQDLVMVGRAENKFHRL